MNMPKMQTFFPSHIEHFYESIWEHLFLCFAVHLLPVEGRQRRGCRGEAGPVPPEQRLQEAGPGVPAPPGQEEDQQGPLHERGEERTLLLWTFCYS